SSPNHTPSSEGDSAISRRQNRTSNHHLAEFNLHVDGRPVGKLAARRTHAADQELARRLWQRLACGLPSRSERWRRNHDVLRREARMAWLCLHLEGIRGGYRRGFTGKECDSGRSKWTSRPTCICQG